MPQISKPSAYVALAVLCSLWVAVHLYYSNIFFDADQAAVGLMAKDLVLRRALPWTYYGQKYMFAIEAWFAAAAFAVAGVSGAALKLPLALVQIATALTVSRTLQKGSGLTPLAASAAAASVAMPTAVTGAYLMGANGANAWPALYIVLIWMLRRRPVAVGLLLGAAYFHREFVAFGAIALLICDVLAVSGTPIRQIWRQRFLSLLVALATYHSLVGLGQMNANFFGGGRPKMPLGDMTQLCRNAAYLMQTLLPTAFGFRTGPVADFGLNSGADLGVPFLSVIVGIGFAVLSAWTAVRTVRQQLPRQLAFGFPLYCVLATLGQFAAYALLIPADQPALLRYVLLAPLGLTGVLGLGLLAASDAKHLRCMWMVLACAAIANNVTTQLRLVTDRMAHPFADPRQALATELMTAGYKFGWAEYWDAYYLTFITDESLTVAAQDFTRFRRYRDELKQHAGEAFILTTKAQCAAAKGHSFERWYICPLANYQGDIPALSGGR